MYTKNGLSSVRWKGEEITKQCKGISKQRPLFPSVERVGLKNYSCTLCVPMFYIGMVWKGWRAIHWNYRQSLQLHQCIQPVTNKMPDSQ